MLEKKFAVGTRIDNLKSPAAQGSTLPGEVSYGIRSYTCGAAAALKRFHASHIALTDGGAGADSFIFLPWVEDAVNYVESQGRDVLSGPFTGCIMAAYMRNGSRRIGHVSTPGCNALWAGMKNESEVSVQAEFKPANADFDFKSIKSNLKIYGLITADDQCYSVVCDLHNTKGSHRIVKVVKMGKTLAA